MQGVILAQQVDRLARGLVTAANDKGALSKDPEDLSGHIVVGHLGIRRFRRSHGLGRHWLELQDLSESSQKSKGHRFDEKTPFETISLQTRPLWGELQQPVCPDHSGKIYPKKWKE